MELFGDEARLVFSPFRRYRALAEERSQADVGWLTALRRPLAMLFIIAGFVSLTSAGRLVWYHVLFAMVAWSFVPALQIAFIAIILRSFRVNVGLRQAVDLFYTGYAPWLLFLLALAGLCAFVPHPWRVFEAMLDTGVLFGAIILVFSWSVLLTFAFFKHALGLGSGRGLRASLAYYGPFAAAIGAYYVVTGQLVPLLGGAPW